MTVRIVTPASGALSLTFAWGDGTEILTAGDAHRRRSRQRPGGRDRAGQHDAAELASSSLTRPTAAAGAVSN